MKKRAKRKSDKVKVATEMPALTFTTPNGEGRPTKYKPEYCKKIVEFMKEGGETVYKLFNYEGMVIKEPVGKLPRHLSAFAREIDVSDDTLNEWCKVHPEFSAAYKKAKAIQLEQMVDGASAGILQAAPTIFALKNMHRWTDKQLIGGIEGQPIGVADKTKERDAAEAILSKVSDSAREELENAALDADD